MEQCSDVRRDAVVCEELNSTLGGEALVKQSKQLMEDIGNIDYKIKEVQYQHQKKSRQMQAQNAENLQKCKMNLDAIVNEMNRLSEDIARTSQNLDETRLHLKNLQTNRIKNNGRLNVLKAKVRKAQEQRKFLTKLKETDDVELDENIQTNQDQLKQQDVTIQDLKNKVQQTKNQIDELLASIAYMNLELESKTEDLKESVKQKQSLQDEKCNLLTEVDKILDSVCVVQKQLLDYSQEQLKQEFLTKDARGKLRKKQTELGCGSQRYNEKCCEYDEQIEKLKQMEKRKCSLQECINNLKLECNDIIKNIQDTECKIQSIHRLKQEKLCAINNKCDC